MQAQFIEALAGAMTQVGGVPHSVLEIRTASGIDKTYLTAALGSRVCTGHCQQGPSIPTVRLGSPKMTKNAPLEIFIL